MRVYPERNAHVRVSGVACDRRGVIAQRDAEADVRVAQRVLLQGFSTKERKSALVIGDARQLDAGARIAGAKLPEVEVLDRANADPSAIGLGKACAEGGRAALDNFTTALDLARGGKLDAVCFTPFNKQALMLAGNRFEDELRYAADHLGWERPAGEFTSSGASGTHASPRTSRSRGCRAILRASACWKRSG